MVGMCPGRRAEVAWVVGMTDNGGVVALITLPRGATVVFEISWVVVAVVVVIPV